MGKSERPGGKSEEGSAISEASTAEQIRNIESAISEASLQGDFDEVLRLSLERKKVQDIEEKRIEEAARREALPSELRRIIEGMKERIAEIENGSFIISDPNLKQTTLLNIKERLDLTEEDLLIAEGTKPSYEVQSEELRKELELVAELYALRWEELVQSGNEFRISAFIEGSRRENFELPDRSPYESARFHVKTNLEQHMAYSTNPRSVRNSLLFVKKKLEESLRRSQGGF